MWRKPCVHGPADGRQERKYLHLIPYIVYLRRFTLPIGTTNVTRRLSYESEDGFSTSNAGTVGDIQGPDGNGGGLGLLLRLARRQLQRLVWRRSCFIY